MIKEIFVRSRKDMKQESYRISEKSVIISISDIDKDRIVFPVNSDILDILSLTFEDWDDPDDKACISELDAEKIMNFVKRWNSKNYDVNLYVNCEAGQSRSAGVAAAISKFLFGDDSWFFKTKTPNMLCYRRVLEQLVK